MKANTTGRRIGTIILVLALTAGCGSVAPSPGAPAPQSGEVQVILQNVQFQPADVTVRAGTRLLFINRDPMLHDVVQVSIQEVGKKEPTFASPPLETGKSWGITLDEPGTYPVVCLQAAHYTAGMIGTITVVP